MPRDRITALFQAALSKHQAGDLVAAEQGYQQLLEVDRQHADAIRERMLTGLIADLKVRLLVVNRGRRHR